MRQISSKLAVITKLPLPSWQVSRVHILVMGDKTVREVATTIMEETKAREVLGAFDGIRTLLKHVIEDGEACMQGANYGVTMMGLNVVKYGEHRQLHANIVKTISKWADTQIMYTLYGSLKPALQTHVEDAEQRVARARRVQ